jgi:hypothetical protein
MNSSKELALDIESHLESLPKAKKKKQTEHMQMNRRDLRNKLTEFQEKLVEAIELSDSNFLQSFLDVERTYSESLDLNFPITKELTTPLMLAASVGE